MLRNPPDWVGVLEVGKRYSVSKTPIDAVLNTSGKLRQHFKPAGLWYACGDEWVDFLESEMPDWLEAINYVYEIVPDMRHMLRLDDVNDILALSRQYGVREYGGRVGYIDWPGVGQMCDGIEICPYQRSLRNDNRTDWYYTWDVASGCIWRPSGVKSLRLVAQR